MEEGLDPLYLQFLPSSGRWQKGPLGLYLAIPPPSAGAQAELVKAHRCRGLEKGQESITLSPSCLSLLGPHDGEERAGAGRLQPSLVPRPLFALLDLGVPRVGRWSCPTQCVSVCVCVCMCVYVCVSVCLSLIPGPRAAKGRDRRSGQMKQRQRGDLPALICTLPTSPPLLPLWGHEWLTKTRVVLQYWRVTGGSGL